MKLSTKDIAIIGVMVAIIEICKVLMVHLPNIELTTFFIIMFTLGFGKKMMYVIPTFILIEGVIFGFGMWWIMYLYLWPMLSYVTWILRKMDSPISWAIVASGFGLLFGFFGAIPYIITSGPQVAFSWWIAGIPWDMVHAVGNFIVMLVLYKPMKQITKRLMFENIQ